MADFLPKILLKSLSKKKNNASHQNGFLAPAVGSLGPPQNPLMSLSRSVSLYGFVM
jgi:hypothetical protein